MAKKVSELEERADTLADDVCMAWPAMYAQNPRSEDPTCLAWGDAVDTTYAAAEALGNLADLLRAKAGIGKSGPSACCSGKCEGEAAQQSEVDGKEMTSECGDRSAAEDLSAS